MLENISVRTTSERKKTALTKKIMEKFHLKSTRISYLDSKIIEQFAIVKLISIESKEFIQINPLCLAAICPAFAQMDFEDPQEDFKILTEYSIQDLEQIVKFCHGEAIPQEPTNIPKIFQVSGVLTYSFLKVLKFLGLKILGNQHANEFFF